MDETKKKLLMGGAAVAAVIGVTLFATLFGAQKKKLSSTNQKQAIVPESELSMGEINEIQAENEYGIDEDLLIEAEEFRKALESEKPKALGESGVTEARGKLERAAIAAVFELWDPKQDALKEGADREKLKFAEASVAQLSEGYVKDALQRILERAEEELMKREAEGESAVSSTETLQDSNESTLSGTESDADRMLTPEISQSPSVRPDTSAGEMRPSATPITVRPSAITAAPSSGQSVRQESSSTAPQTVSPVSGNNGQTSSIASEIPAPIITVPADILPDMVILYPWVAGKTVVSYKILTEDNSDFLGSLDPDLQQTLQIILAALEDPDSGDSVIISGQLQETREQMTLLHILEDYYFPYVNSGIGIIKKGNEIFAAGLVKAREAYKLNEEIRLKNVETVRQLINPSTTEKQAVIDINNYICGHFEPGERMDMDSYLKANLLMPERMSCRGYAAVFQDMCQGIGISCRTIFGLIGEDTQYHAWNQVKIDDTWYYCDSIWNEGGSDEYPFLFSEKLWYGRLEQYPTGMNQI